MDSSFANIWTGVVVFASTDIDDLVLLTAFFGDARLRRGSIVAGQFLGIGALMAVSAGAALAALAVPPHWPSLSGAVPLALGLWKLPDLWRPAETPGSGEPTAVDRATAAMPRSQVLSVAAVTVANGGDNLGVYIPLFASDLSALPLFLVIFAVLTGVWCYAGYALVRHPAGAAVMQRFGHIILPIVLILLGAWILSDARHLMASDPIP